MTAAKLRAGIVGAGNVCELHVAAVKELAPEVELVGVTDGDVDSLIAGGANVIHVMMPPATRANIALHALEKGCHVLIESPLAENVADAVAIGQLAAKKRLVATVDRSLLYDPQVKRTLDAVRAGAIGEVVSVDILRGSEYPTYEGGPLPPWYREAGYPFRDLGVHGLYLVQEVLGPIEDVEAEWRSIGGDPNLAFDEWRARVRCKRGLGELQLTWNVKPTQSQMIIHGTRGMLRVDLLARSPGKRLWQFFRKEAQAYAGVRELVADFYRRIAAGEAPAASIDDAAQVVRWVEQVARAAEEAHAARLARFQLSQHIEYVVTGASGSLGRAVVKRLVGDGKRVRVFVRRIPEHPMPGVEYVFGNLGDPRAIDRAIKGADVVIHCGAAMKGSWAEHKCSTVVGTQNVIDACKRYGTRQLVYISSMSVVDWAGSAGNGPVTENAALEPRPDERGAYTRAKLEAERLVAAAATAGLPCVILRPGQIFGGGIPLINGAVARNAGGRWLVLGDGKLELPLVYIDDVVDAIVRAIDKRLVRGEIIQIIDPEPLTQEQVLGLAGGTKQIMRVPRPLLFALGKLTEYPLGALGKQSPVAVYRLKSALARLHYESERATELLGWRPQVGVREGIRRVAT